MTHPRDDEERHPDCTCYMETVHATDIDPPDMVRDPDCPIHGWRDPDQAYDDWRDRQNEPAEIDRDSDY